MADKEYIEREALICHIEKEIERQRNVGLGNVFATVAFAHCKRKANEIPTADVVEVRHRNPDDENCVICNSELGEKYAGGIWDLAGEICSIICPECDHDEQDTVYNIIRNYIEAQNYCPKCGAKMDGGK